jgi:hypothetical protein
MSIDYKQLKSLVKEAMFTGGGINEPSAPEGIPHRMPAAEPPDHEQDMGEPAANEMYDLALAAREAVEKLVEALDSPIFDGAYEHAFKASACMRRALNSIEDAGAHPMSYQRVVAPPVNQQKYDAGRSAGVYSLGASPLSALEEGQEGEQVAKTGPGEEVLELLQKITDEGDIIAITNFLIKDSKFPLTKGPAAGFGS